MIKLPVLAALTAAALLASPAARAVPGDRAEVGAFGNADYFFTCASFTCDGAGGNLSTQSQSSPLGGTVEVNYSGLGGSNGGAQFAAFAQSGSGLGLPLLRALAVTQHARGDHPGYSEPGFYDYNASAIANAVQYYTYTGSVAAFYEFTFHVDGTLVGQLASVDAFAGLFDVDTTFGGELPLGQALVMDRLMFSGLDSGALEIDDEFTLGLTLEPGQDFYLSAVLSANVGRGFQLSGTADIFNTFTASLTQGDPALLRVGQQAATGVPEPATLVLLAIAAIGAAGARRRGSAVAQL